MYTISSARWVTHLCNSYADRTVYVLTNSVAAGGIYSAELEKEGAICKHNGMTIVGAIHTDTYIENDAKYLPQKLIYGPQSRGLPKLFLTGLLKNKKEKKDTTKP